MEKIPVKNDTKMPMYVNATMIPPGETRHFDAADVPTHLRPAPAAEPAAPAAPDSMVALLAKSVKEIEADLPALSDEELQRLSELELTAESPRKTLLAALDEEQMNRAIAAEEAAK